MFRFYFSESPTGHTDTALPECICEARYNVTHNSVIEEVIHANTYEMPSTKFENIVNLGHKFSVVEISSAGYNFLLQSL